MEVVVVHVVLDLSIVVRARLIALEQYGVLLAFCCCFALLFIVQCAYRIAHGSRGWVMQGKTTTL